MFVAMTPYLFFGGRCDEAIAFYADALGAQLLMRMTFDQSPEPAPEGMLQAGFETKVMHSSLKIGEATLFLSDGCDDRSKFEGFRLALSYSDETEARRVFEKLSDGGVVDMPLVKTFWSPCYGMVTDRFKVEWMVMVPAEGM